MLTQGNVDIYLMRLGTIWGVFCFKVKHLKNSMC